MQLRRNLFPRNAFDGVQEALSDTRIVVLNGARQVGKSTLAELVVASYPNGRSLFLDEALTRQAAQSDPSGLVRHDGLLLIDEVQRVPDLLLAIKHEVDRDPRPGRFLLTGSARLLGLRSMPDALPGRAETIELWPLSQGEIDGHRETFIDNVFHQGVALPCPATELRRRDYLGRMLRGGFPEAVRRDTPRRRSRFFESYISDLIARDVRQISEIQRGFDMRRLLGALAARVCGLLKTQPLSSDLGFSWSTLRRYLDALELIYVIRRIPGWFSNLTTRAVAVPKLLFVDSGLAAYLCGTSAERAADPVAPIGPLVENFALGELARQITWAEQAVRLYHYRDRDGNEVDAILENPAGRVVGIEVKAAETVRGEDFRGLARLRERLGDRMVAGFILYTGAEKFLFGERLACLPIATLWNTVA